MVNPLFSGFCNFFTHIYKMILEHNVTEVTLWIASLFPQFCIVTFALLFHFSECILSHVRYTK